MVDRAIARRAAELRAEHASLRLTDAMSLTTALVSDADLLTLDKKVKRISNAHLIEEFEEATKIDAEEAIRAARRKRTATRLLQENGDAVVA